MARRRSIVTGSYSPVKDKRTGQQVVDPERGRKWRITAELPRSGGKRKRKYRDVYGSERKAHNEMHKFVGELNRNITLHTIPNTINVDASKMTFGECVEMWLEANRDNGSLKRLTWESYVKMARNHIIPYLGHIMLQDLSPYHISRYKEIKLGDGQRFDGGKLNPGTVNKHLAVINNVLEDAATEKALILHNPARLVARARGGNSNRTAVVNCLTATELNDLLSKLALLYSLRGAGDAIKNKPETIETLKRLGFTDKEIRSPKALHKFKVVKLYPIVYLAAVTGMRLSELLALKWDNLNLQKGKIKVYESSHYGTKEDDKGNSHHINPTKENKPKSDIDLSQSDVEFLKSYRQEQLARRARYRGKYTDYGLVFTNNNGSHLRNDTVSKEFTYFARSINVSITFHGLRHTHCTLLLASGVPDIYVARRVGHQKPSTTTDTYGHAEKGAGANLGDVFKDILAEDQQCNFDHNVEGPKECNVESGDLG